jgi:hypothetical protein
MLNGALSSAHLILNLAILFALFNGFAKTTALTWVRGSLGLSIVFKSLLEVVLFLGLYVQGIQVSATLYVLEGISACLLLLYAYMVYRGSVFWLSAYFVFCLLQAVGVLFVTSSTGFLLIIDLLTTLVAGRLLFVEYGLSKHESQTKSFVTRAVTGGLAGLAIGVVGTLITLQQTM